MLSDAAAAELFTYGVGLGLAYYLDWSAGVDGPGRR